jgi:hypothetical protein
VSSETLTSTIGDALERAASIAQQLVQGAPSTRDGHDSDGDGD